MLQGTTLQNYKPQNEVKELEMIDLEIGNGDECPKSATVVAHYTGALCNDGTIFQSSHDFGEAIKFRLNQVIKGWKEGVPGMKVGGKRRLIIPAEMAYGSHSPADNIPANADLVFDIELIAIS